MARKAANGEVNKSQEIRDLLKSDPAIKATDVVKKLADKGVKITPALFYLVKGKVAGRKSRRKQNQRNAVFLATKSQAGAKRSDAVAIIRKVKEIAAEVGGLRALSELIEALSE
mgnify:CR=1 FL=1